jgi:hypothetical protein
VLPLLGILLCDELVDHSLVGLFVGLLLRGILLQLDGLSAVRHLFLVFDLLNHSLAFNRSLQQLQVTLLFGELGLFSKTLLLLVVLQEAKISLSIQNLALALSLLLPFLVQCPLSFKHFPLDCCQIFFLVTVDLASLLLPF